MRRTLRNSTRCCASPAKCSRGGESLNDLVPASTALSSALERIEPPRDVRRLEQLFQRIAVAADDLRDIVGELQTAQESPELTAKTRRISELTAQGLNAQDAALTFAAEREAERQRPWPASRRAWREAH